MPRQLINTQASSLFMEVRSLANPSTEPILFALDTILNEVSVSQPLIISNVSARSRQQIIYTRRKLVLDQPSKDH